MTCDVCERTLSGVWCVYREGTGQICQRCVEGNSSSSAPAQSCASRVAGRLEALKEKFKRQADRCQEQERYEAMDIWRDAAADVEEVQDKMEL
jgi:excinuclease UvrABC nuclease subunit